MFRLAVLLVCLLSPGLASPTRGRLRRTGQARIIGGSEASISSFPWQVSVESAGDHTCGGSLISPDWVLTSSLCLDGFSGVFEHILQFVSLRAGTSTRGSGGVVLLAAEMYEHPLYIPLTVDYDVALIKTTCIELEEMSLRWTAASLSQKVPKFDVDACKLQEPNT
ncbi:trypsin-7-like [Schistocerca americana]|uniref:trypsin-7-like n=1 Tax=Schistocerca americana TaxID=7009 RepID=UPI001F4F217C|nr:trypsin-7-like [Schistocerca americana]